MDSKNYTSSMPEHNTQLNTKVVRKEDDFSKSFDTILSKIPYTVENIDGFEINDCLEWLKVVMQYNVPHGKQLRGRLVESTFNQLTPNAPPEAKHQARVLGWCVEILQACFLVADDIMDNGVTRRGQLCWYRVNNMGNIAFNDAFLLEHVAFQMLRMHFGNLPIYKDLMDLVLGVTFKTMLGQSMDTRACKPVYKSFNKYSSEMYNTMVVLKTSYYTVYLPIALALILGGILPNCVENQNLWKNVESVTLKIGSLFQIQDDYFDCFSDDQSLGKVGTDIEEGKCTWLFLAAKEKCTEEQFRTLKENYGSTDQKKVNVVKKVYYLVGIKDVFLDCQRNLHDDIKISINKIDHSCIRNILFDFVDKIYNRKY